MKFELLVNVDVPNLDDAIEFYRRSTPLTLRRRLFEGTVAELSGAAVRVFLLQKEPGGSASPSASLRRDYGRHWTPVHLDFVVDDIDAAVARAVTGGASLEGKIKSYVWGRQASFSDPFGHGFCLLAWAGRGYDEVATSGGLDEC